MGRMARRGLFLFVGYRRTVPSASVIVWPFRWIVPVFERLVTLQSPVTSHAHPSSIVMTACAASVLPPPFGAERALPSPLGAATSLPPLSGAVASLVLFPGAVEAAPPFEASDGGVGAVPSCVSWAVSPSGFCGGSCASDAVHSPSARVTPVPSIAVIRPSCVGSAFPVCFAQPASEANKANAIIIEGTAYPVYIKRT